MVFSLVFSSGGGHIFLESIQGRYPIKSQIWISASWVRHIISPSKIIDDSLWWQMKYEDTEIQAHLSGTPIQPDSPCEGSPPLTPIQVCCVPVMLAQLGSWDLWLIFPFSTCSYSFSSLGRILSPSSHPCAFPASSHIPGPSRRLSPFKNLV